MSKYFHCLLLFLLLVTRPVAAHPLRPVIVDLSFPVAGRIDLRIQLNLETLMAGIGTAHQDTDDSSQAQEYRSLRLLAAADLESKFIDFEAQLRDAMSLHADSQRLRWSLMDISIPAVGDTRLARLSSLRYSAAVPADAKRLKWQFASNFGDSLLRVQWPGETQSVAFWLQAGEATDEFVIGSAAHTDSLSVIGRYLRLGFTHILPYGGDHILFVLGLFFCAIACAR